MTDTTQPSCRTHLTDAEVATLTAERDAARAALAPLDGTDWTPATLLRAYREMSQAHEDGQREVGRLTATRDRVVAAADALEVDGMHEAAQRIRAALNPDAHPRAVPITSAERASLLDGALARATRERDEARAEAQRLAQQLADARGRACDALCRDVARDRDRLATKLGQAYAKLAQWRATFGESALRSAQHVRAERERLRADLARAQELIAELRDVAERADRAFARYDTGGGETPPDLGSAPRAQGVAVDGPETAVDGQTPVTGSRGMGRDANGAQNATQAAGVWEDRSPRCAHCGCPRTHHDRADGGCNGDFLTCTCRRFVPVVRVEG